MATKGRVERAGSEGQVGTYSQRALVNNLDLILRTMRGLWRTWNRDCIAMQVRDKLCLGDSAGSEK